MEFATDAMTGHSLIEFNVVMKDTPIPRPFSFPALIGITLSFAAIFFRNRRRWINFMTGFSLRTKKAERFPKYKRVDYNR